MVVVSGGAIILKPDNVAKQMSLTKIAIISQLSPHIYVVSSIAQVAANRRVIRSMVGLRPKTESKIDYISKK